MTTLIDRLESIGLMQRWADPDDRRRVLVTPTELADTQFELALTRYQKQLVDERNDEEQLGYVHTAAAIRSLTYSEAKQLRADGTAAPQRSHGKTKVEPPATW